MARITATGTRTELRKIGKAVAASRPPKTLLHRQISQFVQRMAAIGILVFLFIRMFNYFHGRGIIQSLLEGLILALATVIGCISVLWFELYKLFRVRFPEKDQSCRLKDYA